MKKTISCFLVAILFECLAVMAQEKWDGSFMALDFERAVTVKTGGGGNCVGSFQRTDAEKKNGQFSGKLNFDFTSSGEVYRNRYVEYQLIPPLGELQAGNRIGMWVKAKGEPYNLRVRIIDRCGETFQSPPLLAGSPAAAWTYVTGLPANSWGHWGGDKNGKIDYPARLIALVIDKTDKSASYQTKGFFYVDDLSFITIGQGEFAGRLTDHAGAALANAEIKVFNEETLIRTIHTDERGMYSLRLPLGTYPVVISKDGYQTQKLEIRITSNSITERNLSLKGE